MIFDFLTQWVGNGVELFTLISSNIEFIAKVDSSNCPKTNFNDVEKYILFVCHYVIVPILGIFSGYGIYDWKRDI